MAALLVHKVAAAAIAIAAFVTPISGTQVARAAVAQPTPALAPAPLWVNDTPDSPQGLTVTTADFAGNSYGVSANGLVRRYDPTGIVAASWAAASGAVQIQAISVDRSLEVNVSGRPLLLPVVMGSGAKATTITGPFVARFTADGDLRWVRSLTTTNPFALAAQSGSAIGESGSVFVSGQYSSLSIDGLSLPTAFNVDGFVLRLDATTGKATWLTAMTVQTRPFQTGAIFVQSLRATAGHVVVGGITGYTTVVGSGSTSRTIPCAGTFSPGSCAYLADFDPATGQPIQALRVATDGSVTQTAVADGNGYTLIAGFGSAITVGAGPVNTGAAVVLTAPPGVLSGFVAHMAPGGAVVWLKQFTGAGHQDPRSLDVDSHGNVIVSGAFSQTMSYGGGPSAPTTTAVGTRDLFLASFDSSGALRWQTTAGGPGTDATDPWQDSLRIDDDGAIHLGGAHTGPMTFGSGAGAITITGTNAFLAVYRPDQPSAGVGFEPISSARVYDTRNRSPGTPQTLRAGAPITVDLSGLIPAQARAVALNITATGSTQPTYITAYPSATALPRTSNLNVAAGETIANQVTVRVGGGSKVSFATADGAVDLVIDISGYFAPPMNRSKSTFQPLTPTRMLDSRTTTGGWTGPLGPGETRYLTIGGVGPVPTRISAVAFTLTATTPTGASFLEIHSSGSAAPGVSNLIFAQGQTISNLVLAGVGGDGAIAITNQQYNVDVVIDLVGYFDYQTGGKLYHALNPTRVLDDRVGTGLSGPWGPGVVRTLPLPNGSAIPTDAGAVLGNLTATNGSTGSYLSTFAGGASLPATSTLAFGPQQTVATSFVAALGSNGSLSIANHLGTVDVVVDLNGYFATT